MTGARSVFARAFDPASAMPDDETSGRILDAALEVACASGLRHLTMDEVARQAGVSRVTVYRRFADREGMLDALMLRETRKNLVALRQAVDVRLPPEDQITEGFVQALRLARRHPLLHRIMRVDRESPISSHGSKELVAVLRAFLAAQIHAARLPNLRGRRADVELRAELVVRLGLSFFLLPDGLVSLDDEAAVRAMAKDVIVAMLLR